MDKSDDKQANKKYKFYRKPSFKKKAPEVKQTKTSMKRMILVNPTLKYSSNSEKIEAPKPIDKPTIPKNIPPKVVHRRSLSAQHFDKKKSEKDYSSSSASSSGITQSMDNIHTMSTAVQNMSTIAETSREGNQIIFKTPLAHDRRSIFKFTPISSCNRRSLYRPTTPLPSLVDLQKRLNDWLKKRGKSTSMFYHLKSFTPPNIEEGNKENIGMNGDVDRSSYDDLRISKYLDCKNTIEDSEELDKLAKAALTDLYNLIQEGYSITHCEGWLNMIKNKYKKLQDDPDYWECRAAIEQGRGNIYNAVEFYKTAIVQGAEVSQVDKSLDVLLKKFSLLNISPDNAENGKSMKERARIVQDARNVFKSSIIKFAVLEKKHKQNNQEVALVATPVRRSARRSRSMYTSTPGVKLYSSLKEIDTSDREHIGFKQNKALN